MPHEQATLELLVTVADDVGLDLDDVAPDPLRGEPATVDFGNHAINRHAPPPGRGKVLLSLRHLVAPSAGRVPHFHEPEV
jgi:hypothetical protein